MHVFLGDNAEIDAAHRPTFLALADAFAGRFVSISVPKADFYMLDDFGLPRDAFPAFGTPRQAPRRTPRTPLVRALTATRREQASRPG
jgi:hypothetical protein